jgi:hypothetical protein
VGWLVQVRQGSKEQEQLAALAIFNSCKCSHCFIMWLLTILVIKRMHAVPDPKCNQQQPTTHIPSLFISTWCAGAGVARCD